MAAAALKNRIENLIAMAQLLERVDANPTIVGAQQYLNLVNTVKTLLAEDDLPEDALRAVLRACPASATALREHALRPLRAVAVAAGRRRGLRDGRQRADSGLRARMH
jgi:hypothetical protein